MLEIAYPYEYEKLSKEKINEYHETMEYIKKCLEERTGFMHTRTRLRHKDGTFATAIGRTWRKIEEQPSPTK